jgi:hypothetical protein
MRNLTVVLFSACVAIQSVSVPAFVVPDFSDLTIKTRQTFGELSSTESIQVVYLKGPRERREYIVERPRAGERHFIVIYQCDKRRTLELNAEAKIYGASPFEDWSEHLTRLRPAAQPQPAGVDVTIATDAVDTGERRRVGGHVARHVSTRVTVEVMPGANTRPRTEETDGWYLDLPGIGCSNAGAVATTAFLSGEVVRQGGVPDRLHFKTLGNARRGFPIEETDRQTEGDRRSTVRHLELVDFSERPLDTALFELPSDYRPALPRVHGGRDLTKPDTVTNRLQSYWDELALWIRALLH